VLWVHADTEATFSQDYKAIAQKLRINANSLSEEDLFEAVRDGIDALPNWVLIVDNADDLKIFGVGQTALEAQSLFQFIPRASTGTVLWTTRDANIAGTLVGQGQGIEIARMTFEEATQLLKTFKSLKLNKEEAEISSLIKELHSLPLAIMQAGAYMSRTSTTPKEYLTLLAESKKRWDILKMDDLNRHRRRKVPNNVLETWAISITRIKQESEMTYKILHVIAYVSNENIPHEMITTMLSHIDKNLKKDLELLEPEAIRVITRLKEFSFIGIRQAEDGSKNYEMHKLVQEALRYGLGMRKPRSISETGIAKSNILPDKRQTQTSRHKILPALKNFAKRMSVDLKSVSVAESNKYSSADLQNVSVAESDKYFSTIALQATSDLFPAPQPDAWKQCEKYLTHVLQIGEWVDVNEKQIETAQLLIHASTFLYHRGRWRERERVDKMILQLTQKSSGLTHTDTVNAIAGLATTYHKQGRYSEAEALKIQVLDNRREILGDEHIATTRAIADLASVYHEQGRHSDAEALDVQVIESRREILGDEHPDTIQAIANLAVIYYQQGRHRESEPLQLQVLVNLQETFGDKHPNTLKVMGNLASTYDAQGRHSESEPLRLQVLDSLREILGDKHPDTIQAMANLAAVYHQQGRDSKAEPLQLQALDTLREVFGDKHPHTLIVMSNLASIYHAQGQYSESETLEIQVLDSRREILGDKHPDTIRAISNLALTYQKQGQHSEAEALQVQVLDSRREILGEKHPQTIIALNNLAWTWYNMSRHQDAIALMQQALEYSRSTLGPDHPQTKKFANSLQRFESHQRR
jgi:tetratricopeptide (TPR) repeat protein